VPIRSVNFGRAPEQQYDNGTQASISINAQNRCVEVHRGESANNLYFRVAQVRKNLIFEFFEPKPPKYDDGNNPTVALTDQNVVIEAHDSGGKLYYSVRMLRADNTVSQASSNEFPNQDPSSSDVALAVNGNGVLLAVHVSAGNLFWRLGTVSGSTVTWQQNSHAFGESGDLPHVAINTGGRAVAVYRKNGDELHYQVGQYSAANKTITWQPRERYENGTDPSVAITDRDVVFEAHKATPENDLNQRVGRISGDGKKIDWQPWLGGDKLSYEFDNGVRPRIATNGVFAVHVHESETRTSLFGTACLVFDRANWIGDNFTKLRATKLRELVLPAAHDAGKYDHGLQTQKLNILQQLSIGVRWFDLRLIVDDGKIKIHHNVYVGVDFQDILDDVRRFMQDHHELVILKLSHFTNFDERFDKTSANRNGISAIDKVIQMIRDRNRGIVQSLVTGTLPNRLGATELRELISPRAGAVLVVVDNKDEDDNVLTNVDFDKSLLQNKGIRKYRDWYADDPEAGDLTVFDIYSNTADFDRMAEGTGDDPDERHARERPGTGGDAKGKRLPVGQFEKFDLFDGVCRLQSPSGNDVPCDLFLLSWTLTESGLSPIARSRQANKRLVEYSARFPNANSHKRIINLLFTDVVEDSRSADVAMVRNDLVNVPG
jgi:hypothetical protein